MVQRSEDIEQMIKRNTKTLLTIVTLAACRVCGMSLAQQAPKPLTNDGVIEMVQAGLSESVIVAAIQSSPAHYDISTDGLIKLKKAGVTADEMKAIIAAQQPVAAAGSAAISPEKTNSGAAKDTPPAAPVSRWEMPSVYVLTMRSAQELPREKTQLAETKTKPHSLASLAGDSALTQGMQSGVNDVAWDAATHTHSGVGGSAVLQAGNIFGGMMGHRQATVTYVWGTPGRASPNVLQTSTPKFEVNFAKAPGVNPDEFAPEIVRLTPAQNTCRLVGATQGKEDARSDNAADWEIYSAFIEDRVPVNLEKLSSGDYNVSPQTPLLPGEYAAVLRPIAKDKKFSGGDVARGQGAGLMFNAVWTFQIADTAQ
jgi:hypothetical protein